MGREKCMMCEELGGKLYCGYYDIAVMPCEENQDCPEELDEEGDDIDVGDLGWPYDGTDDGER
jgi:hypothetical protein